MRKCVNNRGKETLSYTNIETRKIVGKYSVTMATSDRDGRHLLGQEGGSGGPEGKGRADSTREGKLFPCVCVSFLYQTRPIAGDHSIPTLTQNNHIRTAMVIVLLI